MTTAPFSQARWELEGRHLFHLPQEHFAKLEQPKSTYLVGTRGTGKTTLLKALNWRERITNPSLQRQLRRPGTTGGLFAGHYVGVYFKLPRTQLNFFDRYVGPKNPLYTNFLSLYLALNWIDLLAEATAGLFDEGILSFTPEREQQAVIAIHDFYIDYPLVNRYLSADQVRTLAGLSRGIRRMRMHIERDLQSGAKATELAQAVPMGRLAEFGMRAANSLSTLYPRESSNPWYFLVCMDEGESLTPAQQTAMNSLARVAERPLFPVVAYVSNPYPLMDTDGPMTVTNADVNVVRADLERDREFQRFVEGVASVRMQAATGCSDTEVDLHSLLGRLDIDRLLERQLSQSTDAWAQALLKDAEQRRRPRNRRSNDAPPVYQTYLAKALRLSSPSAPRERWEVRRQDSAENRKKIVAAYLSICQRIGNEPRYASADMLLQMCDRCVRDFLWQMHELYVEANTSPSEFLRRRLSDDLQDRALRRASANKMNRVGDFVLAETTTVNRLVDTLGRLTSRLQRPPESKLRAGFVRHLRSNEPGAFRLPAGDDLTRDDALFSLVREAVEANYLRWAPTEETPIRFRVHTSLAAHYGFSYRGAYSDTVLTLGDLRRICETNDQARLDGLIEGLMRRLTQDNRGGGTLPLFEAEE